MKTERDILYQDLLRQFKEECLFLETGDINSRGRVFEQIDEFLVHDADFRSVYFALLNQHRERLVNTKIARHVTSEDLIEELSAFVQGKPVDFTDTNLCMLIGRFADRPDFRKRICNVPALYQAFLYWKAEYRRRLEQDDAFAIDVLISKLYRFSPDVPYSEEFATLVRDLLDRFSEHPIFQQYLQNEDNPDTHKALTYWQQVSQRRAKNK